MEFKGKYGFFSFSGSHADQVLFLIVLSAQYLMIGVGTTLSIMAVAFAISTLKEHNLQNTADHLSRSGGMGMITMVRAM